MTTLKVALKEAGWTFLVSRLVLVVLTILGMAILRVNSASSPVTCTPLFQCSLLAWMHYDVFSYIYIAMYGYVNPSATAFFPLWPLLLHSLGFLTSGSVVHYYILGIVLANLLFYLALVIFYLLSVEIFDHNVAKKALMYLAFAPYALYFFIGYTESLFILFCLATFFFLQRSIQRGGMINWLLAGLCGFFASLTRSQGFLLALPYAFVFMQQYLLADKFRLSGWYEKILALAPIILIPFGVVVYMLYLWYTKGDPLLFSHVEATSWNRSLTFPWMGVYYALKALFVPGSLQILNAINLASFVVTLLVLLTGWRRMPLYYNLFALMLIIFPMCYIQGTANALTALPRYMLVVFPVVMITASWKRPRLETLAVAFSLVLFTFNSLLFMTHYWVA
jgi:hypothetical protein